VRHNGTQTTCTPPENVKKTRRANGKEHDKGKVADWFGLVSLAGFCRSMSGSHLVPTVG